MYILQSAIAEILRIFEFSAGNTSLHVTTSLGTLPYMVNCQSSFCFVVICNFQLCYLHDQFIRELRTLKSIQLKQRRLG